MVLIGRMEEILEQRPPRGARDDANGLSAVRRFSVLSRNLVVAILRLRDAKGIYRGAPYETPYGEIPDPFCLCQSVESVGKPDAVNGGWGQYILDAEYSRNQTTPRAQPGGGVRWSRRPGITSQPVDVDAEGKAILSSSLEPPDPPLTAFAKQVVYHGEFYVRGDDELKVVEPFEKYENKLNDKPFLGKPRGSLRTGVFLTEPSDTGWVKMSIDLEYREPKKLNGIDYEGWVDVFPDRGRREVIDDAAVDPSDRFAWIRDGRGQSVGDPLPLDGAGRVKVPAISTNTGIGLLDAAAGFLAGMQDSTVLISAKNYLYADMNKIPFPK